MVIIKDAVNMHEGNNFVIIKKIIEHHDKSDLNFNDVDIYSQL